MEDLKGSVTVVGDIKERPRVVVKFIPLKPIFALAVIVTVLHIFVFTGNFALFVTIFGWTLFLLAGFINWGGKCERDGMPDWMTELDEKVNRLPYEEEKKREEALSAYNLNPTLGLYEVFVEDD